MDLQIANTTASDKNSKLTHNNVLVDLQGRT